MAYYNPSPVNERKSSTNSYPIELLKKYATESPVAAKLLRGKVYYGHALTAFASGGNYILFDCLTSLRYKRIYTEHGKCFTNF